MTSARSQFPTPVLAPDVLYEMPSWPHYNAIMEREQIVSTFTNSALTGDVTKFAQTFPALNWPGAWRDVFQRLVASGPVHPSIRPAFVETWTHVKAAIRAGASAPGLDWHLERDFDGHRDLMVDGLKLLLPPFTSRQMPSALFRGQGLEDHRTGRHGCWWTTCPIFAEMFGRMPSRIHGDLGAVVVTFVPEPAIIGVIGGEVLVDPRLLDSVQLVTVLPPYQGGDLGDPSRAFLTDGIPDELDGDALLEWLDHGRPPEGLHAVREERAQMISDLVLDRVAA